MHPVDTHISNKSPLHQEAMHRIRALVRKELPREEEVISYGMPAFKDAKVLLYYEAFKGHLGFYPTAAPIVHFERELKASGLTFSKGAVQLPLQGEWPEELLIRMIAYRKGMAEVKTPKP